MKIPLARPYFPRDTIESVKRLDPTCVGISYGIRIYPGTAISNMTKKDKGSPGLLKPAFYVSEKIGKDLVEYTNDLVSGDRRFFIGASDKSDKNYNYNENLRLQNAIKSGHRGAYWDILQKIR